MGENALFESKWLDRKFIKREKILPFWDLLKPPLFSYSSLAAAGRRQSQTAWTNNASTSRTIASQRAPPVSPLTGRRQVEPQNPIGSAPISNSAATTYLATPVVATKNSTREITYLWANSKINDSPSFRTINDAFSNSKIPNFFLFL